MARQILREEPNEYRESLERKKLVPITNQQIIAKVGFGKKKKKCSSDGIFFYIYKVTCTKNGNIFVAGAASKIDPDQEKGLTPGIPGRRSYLNKINHCSSCISSSLSKHGKENHFRENLLYFDSLTELLKAEELILDTNFTCDDRTLNFRFRFDYEEIKREESYRLAGDISPNMISLKNDLKIARQAFRSLKIKDKAKYDNLSLKD